MSFRRSLLLGILLYAILLLGIGTLNGAMIAAALPLVVYLGTVLLTRPTTVHLDITRTLSHDHTAPDTEVTAQLTVVNTGHQLDEVSIWEQVPPDLTVTGDTSAIVSLGAGERHQLTYQIKGPRGVYHFPGTTIITGEHFGLFQRRQHYNVTSKLFILPSVPRMRRVFIRPLRTRVFAGPYPARRGGSGTDFFGVRTYEPGDPPGWINWRLSARHITDLFTNEFEREQITDIGLILDARSRTNVTVNGNSLFEHAVEATAALAEVFLSEGNRVGLLLYGRGLEHTFPGYGKHQRQRILWALSQAETGDSLVFDSLDFLPTRFFPAKSHVVLISPLCDDDPPVLTRMRAHGYQILVVSPDPVIFEAQSLSSTHLETLATRIARVERTLRIRQLQRVGIPVIDWNIDVPLDVATHASLSRITRQAPR